MGSHGKNSNNKFMNSFGMINGAGSFVSNASSRASGSAKKKLFSVPDGVEPQVQ